MALISERGIPVEFIEARTPERILTLGGFAAIGILVPLVGLAVAIDTVSRGAIGRVIARIHHRPTPVVVSVYLSALVSTMLLISTITGLMVSRIAALGEKSGRVVKAVRLSDSQSIGKYQGLFFITKKGNTFVFADKPFKPGALYILREDEVKELILERAGR